ncbi:isocitrate dehydrogenase kinase/phosphatase [Allopseudospirillum japonicum]|uniref:Isocitrate dehydrogenase kinase/phosphatase n=1 Tax=Allopseudospirillum japonicum TaxID=64971 RepID=A0A1H6U0E3_9GAMM|nr:bifunctional isocitrate dehydrogenase kinase/phosphatase [Allopseudospirillum japonicum]SEI85741.1 isocitrate dehydrogenase kinase/phosphatase [Allopseudospirillum japonicum]
MQQDLQTLAHHLLQGFDDYRFRFRQITQDAPQYFAQAHWQAMQQASAERIDLYETRIKSTCAHLPALAHQVAIWPDLKQVYRQMLSTRLDAELAETWFNSVYCHLFAHAGINNQAIFVDAEPRPIQAHSHIPLTRSYLRQQTGFAALFQTILTSYSLGVPFFNLQEDCQFIESSLIESLPSYILADPYLDVQMLHTVFYRNKGAYLVGRILSGGHSIPLVLPLVHAESQGVFVDTLIIDPEQVSIVFSFTRSYFMVDVPIPAEFVAFLKQLMPNKETAELYTAIGFYKHGKTEFYRSLLSHLAHTSDQFVMAAGVKGMVMSVFTLPGFNSVFKIIKDKFAPPKEVSKATVKAKYALVKRLDRVGRMADTQEFSNFCFPVSRFAPECLQELLDVAPSTVEVQGDQVLIHHLWTERRMIPLNLYLQQANAKETVAILQDYGRAIKQLAAANIFPGDMLLKNFGVTRHGRVVFYDYDEISDLTEMNFREIPEPRFPEDELAAEPWYSVAPNDVFPEEFATFLFRDPQHRRIFQQEHAQLFQASYWRSVQDAIHAGQLLDVYPYPAQQRFRFLEEIL